MKKLLLILILMVAASAATRLVKKDSYWVSCQGGVVYVNYTSKKGMHSLKTMHTCATVRNKKGEKKLWIIK